MTLREHETWWETTADPNGTFKVWLTESDPWSRSEVVRIARDVGARSVLEAGPGLFVDYTTHWAFEREIAYEAVELTLKLAAAGRAMGAVVKDGSIVALPNPDNSVDMAYCRHVLEHLAPEEVGTALAELVRVAEKAAVVVFFQMADAGVRIVRDREVAVGTFCNHYGQRWIEELLGDLPVDRLEWTTGGRDWVLTIHKRA